LASRGVCLKSGEVVPPLHGGNLAANSKEANLTREKISALVEGGVEPIAAECLLRELTDTEELGIQRCS
jgi:hypothetical protein